MVFNALYEMQHVNDWWETSPIRENLADTDPPLTKRRFSIYFRSYISASDVTPNQKVQLTLIGSLLYAFQ